MAELKFNAKEALQMILDPAAESGIKKVLEKVSKDIKQTTGVSCVAAVPGVEVSQAVIIATDGCGELADTLKARIPELKQLEGKWESYGFYLTEQPIPGVQQGLVIVGSDKLGTIYGMFHLSELLGVTAWGFWGDVTPPVWKSAVLTSEPGKEDKKDGNLCLSVENFIAKEPSVKYRGFFINDEWPCYGNWTHSHYNGFTAEMYDHIFEYLLRMKGNYLWPAMWTSNFLLDGPGLANMELATEYGIYIGMSHHEPCMRSGAEFAKFKGPDSPYGEVWNYSRNKEGILKFWEDGLSRVKGQTIFPTVGMRGENDSKLLGEDATIRDNVEELKEIITKQREIIAREIDPDPKKVPMLFAIYKEVEDYYFGEGGYSIRGYKALNDVTLMFCEDNFGNMRALPQGEERNHPGGFGMYYHVDYHGSPISFEWVNSSPISKMWEQMTEAYEYGIKNVWILNVGDVKFNEYPLGYFLSLAYDFEKWGSGHQDRIKEYTREWVKAQFSTYVTEEQLDRIVWVLEESVRLNGLRRPECLNDTIYHPAHYNEGRRMLARAQAVEEENEKLYKELENLPCKDAYFSMIYFPAAGSANLLKMHLYSGMNHLFASQGKAVANVYGEKMQMCIARDAELTASMRDFRDGKWSGMELESHIGFVNWNDEDWRYPVQHVVTLPKKSRLVVSRTDDTRSYTNQYFPITLEINDFLYPGNDEVTLQIANGGIGSVCWNIPESCKYLEFSKTSGSTEYSEDVVIRVLRDKIPTGTSVEFHCNVRTETEFVPVVIRAAAKDLSEVPEGAFLMEEGVCVMDAADFAENIPGRDSAYQYIPDYGKFESAMKAFPSTAVYEEKDWTKGQAPSLVYHVWAEEAGNYRLDIHTSPANALIYGGPLRMGAAVNEEPVKLVNLVTDTFRGGDTECEEWCTSVLDQEHVASVQAVFHKGLNTITLYPGDAGVALEHLVICQEGSKLQKSYLGPKKSFRK